MTVQFLCQDEEGVQRKQDVSGFSGLTLNTTAQTHAEIMECFNMFWTSLRRSETKQKKGEQRSI